MEKLVEAIRILAQDIWAVEIDPVLSRPDEQFGDFSTNVAMHLASILQKNPREIAEELAGKLRSSEGISDVTVAGPGFINIRLNDAILINEINQPPVKPLEGQEILVEFGDPNPFKEMHLGHLYSTIVGDSISRLLEVAGASVRRLSYHGDVGRHVARAIYGMKQSYVSERGIPSRDDLNDDVLAAVLSNNLGFYYAAGAQADEDGSEAAQEISQINRHVYARDDDVINELYDWGKYRSFGYFDLIFEELGVTYDENGRFLESLSADKGVKSVRSHIGTVFEESNGAIIYRGERAGLHTRVFINSEGLPTYEAKDLGLTELKSEKYIKADLSIVITANEQVEYFKVMLAALREYNPSVANKTKHISHGFLTLTTGKMSSRTGEVYAATTLLENTNQEIKQSYPETDEVNKSYLAAVKYALLKHRIGGDIVFDIHESISLHGNSGPYLQYAHARACGILSKSEKSLEPAGINFHNGERSLALKLSQFNETTMTAASELMPHYICTYLFELAQCFNSFYEHNRVLGDERETIRLWLVKKYADTLKIGLGLLGIIAPDHM